MQKHLPSSRWWTTKVELKKDQYKVLLAVTMPTEKTQTKQATKQTKKTNQNKQNQDKQTTTHTKTKRAAWSAGQFNVGNLMKGDSIVSSLVSSYGLEWRSNQKQQNRQQSQKQPNTNSVRKGTNTTLSGNQGSPQPGAPKSHSVSRTGNKTHRIGAIQKLAMAMPCSKWKGDTK